MSTHSRFLLLLARTALLAPLLLVATAQAGAGERSEPYSWSHPTTLPSALVPQLVLAPIDQQKLLAEDATAFAAAAASGVANDKRLRVGVENHVRVSPSQDGAWETEADGSRLWRLTVASANATDLRFGFGRFAVPDGVTLHLVNDAAHLYAGALTRADATPDGQLWTAPIAGSTITLELHVPRATMLAPDAIELTNVASGYRNSTGHGGPGLFGAGPSGACNIDVICPLGDSYRDDIRAVAKYYFEEPDGTYLCSGTLVNNTSQDLTPYFLTANHCINTQTAATSMSLIWNYQSPTCGQHGGGSTSDTQNGGATLVAHRTDVDFSLVRLNSTPPTGYGVYYAGWDATGLTPGGSIGIHHPSGWVKAITETAHPLTTMNSCIGSGGSQTHWRTGAPYAQGTTEGGSSGSAIVVPAGDAIGHGGLVIGTLSGGSAACNGSVPNNGYDCYGKLAVAWDGASAGARLKDWLDPGATGATTLEGTDPAGNPTGPVVSVNPASLSGSTQAGSSTTAPFSVGNTGDAALTFTIDTATDGTCATSAPVDWLSAAPAGGTIAAGNPAITVTATLDAAALGAGSYSADLCVRSNDTTTPVVAVPVSFTVTPAQGGDLIFADGFDGAGSGGVVLTEAFDDITTLAGDGWIMQNNSDGPGTTEWFQSDGSVFAAQDGSDTGFIAANFNNTDGGSDGASGTISNWLVTPLITFDASSSLAFYTRSTIGSDGTSVYPDRLEVRLCTGMPCTDVGSVSSDTGQFTTLLKSINPDLGTADDPTGVLGYPLSDWALFTLDTGSGLPGSGQGRLAFRYFVTGAGPQGVNSNYIGIDTVEIHAGAISAGNGMAGSHGISASNPLAGGRK